MIRKINVGCGLTGDNLPWQWSRPPEGPDLHGSCGCSHKEPKLTLHTKSEQNTTASATAYHVPILFSGLIEFFPASQAQKSFQKLITVRQFQVGRKGGILINVLLVGQYHGRLQETKK